MILSFVLHVGETDCIPIIEEMSEKKTTIQRSDRGGEKKGNKRKKKKKHPLQYRPREQPHPLPPGKKIKGE